MNSKPKVSNYFELFIELTEQRDLNSLNESLLATILILFPDYHFWLFDYQDLDNKSYKLIHSGMETEEFQPEQSLLEQIILQDNNNIKRGKEAGRYTYYSYSILHSLSGFLITDMPLKPGFEEEILLKLVKVYSNQRYFMFSAMNDALTSLLNRQAFDKQMPKLILELQHDKRRESDIDDQSWCFALLDIDHFKQINDRYGHLFGDEVLLVFAQIMQKTFRDDDLLYRYGGEEFAIALKDTTVEQAKMVLNRFREIVSETVFPQLEQVTVSIGVTEISDKISTPVMIDRADQALYYSKEHGRNQVFSFEELSGSGIVSDSDAHEGEIELF